MAKHSFIIIAVFLFFLFTPSIFYLVNYSQSLTITEKPVVYTLPHPGILPDHPLFFLKKIRDSILQFVTRDSLKKVDLYLLLSDKQVNAAVLLTKKGKSTLAIQTAFNAEELAARIPPYLKRSKTHGNAPTAELVDRVHRSNLKHKQVIQQIIKDLPQGESEGLPDAARLNDQIAVDLQKL